MAGDAAPTAGEDARLMIDPPTGLNLARFVSDFLSADTCYGSFIAHEPGNPIPRRFIYHSTPEP